MDIWAISGAAMALTSVTLSFYSIGKHLCNFTSPYLQRYVIRILLMVPIYSMSSWIVMVLPATGLYLDSLREMYESFVIYSFMQYLLNFLKFDTNLQQYIHHKPGPNHIFPFCLLPSCIGGAAFMHRCKHGILQYVLIRPITTLIAFISKLLNFYGEGNYNPFSGYSYPVLLIVNNLSQISAMYCLVIFYKAYQQELAPMRPLPKFFSIKLVVFFSFFQSVVISALMEIPYVEQTFRDLFPELIDKIDLSRKLQEFLICFDMLVAAIGHQFAFSHKPFIEEDRDSNSIIQQNNTNGMSRLIRGSSNQSINSTGCCAAFCHTLDFSDEKNDLWEHFNQIFVRIKGLFTRRIPLPNVVSSPCPPAESSNVSAVDSSNWNLGEEATIKQPTNTNNRINNHDRNLNYQSID